jgi:hypothetical protein
MRVNSTFTRFFINRLLVSIVIPAIFFISSSFIKYSDRDIRAKQVNLIIREIGHRLLLLAGDSTSSVLPVSETNEGTFQLKFENEFVFSHDSLMALSRVLLPKSNFASGYTVTVHDCVKGDIIYGFQLNNTSPDILPCSGRNQPMGCYTIEFAFPDLYEHVETKKANISKPAKLAKHDPGKVNPKELIAANLDDEILKPSKEVTSLKVSTKSADTKLKQSQTATFDYSFINIIYGGVLLLLLSILLIRHFGKLINPIPVLDQNHTLINEAIPEFPALGKFLFNVKGQQLLLGSEVISLTEKECRVLELLHQNFGELIPREILMQKVWIDEGVITGRSLDMFVSKIRKKLSRDTDLRITNIHGKGYKLEIAET